MVPGLPICDLDGGGDRWFGAGIKVQLGYQSFFDPPGLLLVKMFFEQKQVAMLVTLLCSNFQWGHLYRADGDRNAATRAGDALWAEAEANLQQLQAMGERPFHRATAAAKSRRKESVAAR